MPEKPTAAVVASASSVPVELLEQGNTLVRLENFTQASIAVQRPRDLARIQAELIAGVQANPKYAVRLIYCKPVGREDANAPMKFAEELNIRGAEAIASLYNNSSFGWEPVADDGEMFTGVAVWLDYERNIRHTMTFRVSHTMKMRGGGGTMRIPDDRFADVVVKAAASKAVREVILRSIPPWTREALTDAVWEIIGREKGDTDELSRMFAARGVPYQRVEHLMGKKMGELRGDDVARLFGILNALRDGEITVEQAFEESVPSDEGSKAKEVLAKVRAKKGGQAPEATPPPATAQAPATGTPTSGPQQAPPAPATQPKGAPKPAEAPPKAGKRKTSPPVAGPAGMATEEQRDNLFGLFEARKVAKETMVRFVQLHAGQSDTTKVSCEGMATLIELLGTLQDEKAIIAWCEWAEKQLKR